MMVYQDALADNCQKKDDVLIFQIIHLKDKWEKSPKVAHCLKDLHVLNTMELFKTKSAHFSSMWFQYD